MRSVHELPTIIARDRQISQFPNRKRLALSLALVGQAVAFSAITGCGNQISKITGGDAGGNAISVKFKNESPSNGLSLSSNGTVFSFSLGLNCNGTPVPASDVRSSVSMGVLSIVNVPTPTVCENPRKIVVKSVVADQSTDFPSALCNENSGGTATSYNYQCASSNNETMAVSVVVNPDTSFTANFTVRRHGAVTITGVTRVLDASVTENQISGSQRMLSLPPALELTGAVYERFQSTATTSVPSRPASRIKYKVRCFKNFERAAFDISTGDLRGSEKCDGVPISQIMFTAITPRHLAIYNLYAPTDAKIFSGSATVADSQTRLLAATAVSMNYRRGEGYGPGEGGISPCDLDAQGAGITDLTNPLLYTNAGYRASEPTCGGSIVTRSAAIGSAQTAPSTTTDPELGEGEFWIRGGEMSDNPRQAAYLNGEHYVMFSDAASATYKFSLNDVVGKSNLLLRASAQSATPWQYRLFSQGLGTQYNSAGFHLFPIKPTAVFNGTGARVEIAATSPPQRFLSCVKPATGTTSIVYQNVIASECPSGFSVAGNFTSSSYPEARGDWLYVLSAPVTGFNTSGIYTCGTRSATTSASIIYRVGDDLCPASGMYSNKSATPVAHIPVTSSLSFYEGREDLLPPSRNFPYDIRN